MKANELFPGALVRVNRDGLCIKKDTIVEVRAVDADDKLIEKGLIGSAHCRPLDEDQFEGGIWCEYLDPIPLTADILGKSKFSKSRLMGEQQHFTYYLAPSISLLAIYDAEFSLCIGDCARYIKYVHQLQQVFILCGIDKEIVL